LDRFLTFMMKTMMRLKKFVQSCKCKI
jgi:hypothetical protein